MDKDIANYSPALNDMALQIRAFAENDSASIVAMTKKVNDQLNLLGDREFEVIKSIQNWPHAKVECLSIAAKRSIWLSELLLKIKLLPSTAAG